MEKTILNLLALLLPDPVAQKLWMEGDNLAFSQSPILMLKTGRGQEVIDYLEAYLNA
jgi:hypothetical protein